MKVNRRWCSVIGVAALSVAAFAAAAPGNAGAAAQHRFPVINYHPTPKLGNHPLARLAGGLPTFTSTQSDHGTTFRFTMVGKYPRVTQSAPVTTVKAELIPVKFVISGGPSNDPTTGNGCDSTAATTRTTNSPIVKSFSWTFG
ncbi:MAG: hypothetical protein J2P17_35930, partial [Mycobacterium sp.]|nr:hypothetical protein [Mycobacterium sp.]